MLNTAIKIIKAFQNAGFEAYFAGGSVRDMLMEIEPKDYDIATSATPDEIEKVINELVSSIKTIGVNSDEEEGKSITSNRTTDEGVALDTRKQRNLDRNLLDISEHLNSDDDTGDEATPSSGRVIPIGREFGVMLSLVEGHEFEIATFRSDSGYSDGRRPDAIEFTSAKEDAVRRDFTINGLFYDPIEKKVHDFIEGQKDIKNKVIRFIGEPHERIKEDHLRLLRGIRFKNTLQFNYAPSTKAAIKDLAHLAKDISKERINDELSKMLLGSKRSHALKELDEMGLMKILLPELTRCKGVKQPAQYHSEGDVYTHTLKALHDMPPKWATKELVWAILLHDIGKPDTYEEKADRIHFDGHAEKSAEIAQVILKRLRFSRKEISKICWMIEMHMSIGFIPDMRRGNQVKLFWNPWFEDLMKLHYCDENGSHPADLSLYEEVMQLYEDFKDQKLLESHFKPLLNGHELQSEFQLKKGPQLKEILDTLQMAQIEQVVNDKNEAIQFVKGYLKNK